ncbi:MAG: RagB/SusD family nutrient uptake outer membrane protein [Muribaculaceae bacterium]
MKTLNKFFIAVGVASAMCTTSCVGDLDVPVKNPNELTSESFSDDPEGYLERCATQLYQVMATAGNGGAGSSALGFGDAGAGTFTRTIFNLNEITTDNYSWLQFNDAGYYELVTMNFAPDNEVMYAAYSRIYEVVAVCNQFIQTAQGGAFEGADPARIAEYIRQAKIVRGLAFFYAIDCFGNAGYVDENDLAGTEPRQMQRAELFNTVVAGLEAVSAEYGESYATPAYGYVGKEACDALLAKFYLNAATWTGTPMYDKCWNICQKIIANHNGGYAGSGLAESYLALFGANNDQYAAGGGRVNELIWSLPQDGKSMQSYGGSTFYIAASCGSYDGISSITDCNLNAQWTCMVARQQLSELFGFDKNGVTPDLRASIWKTSKDGFVIDNNTIMGNAGYGQGYAPLKYTNFAYTVDGQIDLANSPDGQGNSFADADWTVIRLAEIYLTAAEAHILGGVGSASDALRYVNFVRGRAGVEAWDAAKLTAANILAERDRELYGENDRRTALVRHGKYAGSAYIWNWKGGVQTGAATSERYNLFPIPSKVISFSKYDQNTGY